MITFILQTNVLRYSKFNALKLLCRKELTMEGRLSLVTKDYIDFNLKEAKR